jgi:hypothetical protein
MIPYRKRDGTIYRDVRISLDRGQSYACVRVDIRGSGIEGLLLDEYLRASSRMGWRSSTGCRAELVQRNGDAGISGAASIPAARRPEAPALKAIITSAPPTTATPTTSTTWAAA